MHAFDYTIHAPDYTRTTLEELLLVRQSPSWLLAKRPRAHQPKSVHSFPSFRSHHEL